MWNPPELILIPVSELIFTDSHIEDHSPRSQISNNKYKDATMYHFTGFFKQNIQQLKVYEQKNKGTG